MSIVTTHSKSDSNSAPDWEKYRLDHFPITNKWSYFDHAAVSPLSAPANAAISGWLNGITLEGDAIWPTWAARVETVRATAAELVNADVDEIAFVPSTTAGISLVSEGFPWKAGDNVVIPAGEFPSNVYPWMHLQDMGVELRIVGIGPKGEIDLNRVADACDDRTRMVSASWVGYSSGFRIDPAALARVAHDQGALFFLDAIQGLGVFPLDVKTADVDFFAADGHKWLMGPEGAGLFFCRSTHLSVLRPKGIGWNSVQNPYDFHQVDLKLKKSASRYEGGTQNMVGIHGLGGSLDLLVETGVTPTSSPVAERILELTDRFCKELEKTGFLCQSVRNQANSSGIVSFEKAGVDPTVARNHLFENGVVASVRHGLLRFSPHAYNSEQEIERVVELLSSLH